MSHTEQLTALLYLSSPALPIGAFAYSQGLESAIERGYVTDREDLQSWAQVVLNQGLFRLELPLMNQCHAALELKDHTMLNKANAEVFAARETFELYEEERLLGGALYRLLCKQGLEPLAGERFDNKQNISLIAAFTLAGHLLKLDLASLRLGFIWSWLENQMAVAAKAIPLGQSDTQAIILAMRPEIASMLAEHSAASTTISGSLPGQAMLSSWHETQYSRLFRS